MTRLLLLAALSCVLIYESQSCGGLGGYDLPTKGEKLGTIHVGEIGELVQLYTHLTRDQAKHDYLHYGCFCGLGGGGEPLDDIDRCCSAHDVCYDAGKKAHYPDHTSFWFILLKYHYYAKTDLLDIHCDKQNYPGQRAKCECDRELGKCLEKNQGKNIYNEKYRFKEETDKLCNRVVHL